MLGILAVNVLTILAVVAFSKFILKANWGSHLGLVLAFIFVIGAADNGHHLNDDDGD